MRRGLEWLLILAAAVLVIGLKHRSAWRRLAVVTDKDRFRHTSAAIGWLAPGELRVFDPAQQAEATAWLADPGQP